MFARCVSVFASVRTRLKGKCCHAVRHMLLFMAPVGKSQLLPRFLVQSASFGELQICQNRSKSFWRRSPVLVLDTRVRNVPEPDVALRSQHVLLCFKLSSHDRRQALRTEALICVACAKLKFRG